MGPRGNPRHWVQGLTMTSKVRLLLGDARKLDLPDNSVDLIVTHPPYFGVEVTRYGGNAEQQINFTKNHKKMGKLLYQSVKEMQRVLKPTGNIIIANGSANQVDIRLVLDIVDKTSLRYVDRVVQNSYSFTEEMDVTQFEVINSNCLTTWYHFALPGEFYNNPFAVKKYNNPVWELRFNNMANPVDLELAKTYHVLDAMNKEVPKRFIEMFSKKGDVVLDPFGGSAVVAVTAAELGRQGISNDISNDQVNAAKERLRLTLGE